MPGGERKRSRQGPQQKPGDGPPKRQSRRRRSGRRGGEPGRDPSQDQGPKPSGDQSRDQRRDEGRDQSRDQSRDRNRNRGRDRRRGPGLDGRDEPKLPPRQVKERPPRISEAPDPRGRFGQFGGTFVPETLVSALKELEDVYVTQSAKREFWDDLNELHRTFTGRPVPLMRAAGATRDARRLARKRGESLHGMPPDKLGATIWYKREDLAHTGAHKINNTLGQALLAKKMGKHRIIAETGAGQHGVASATAAAKLGLRCDVYMGAEDVRRQHLNVVRMQMLGARVIPVESGSRTLKDATNEAMRDWMGSVENTHYIIGSVVGPHPFPMIVRDFQSVIGRETKAQCLRQIGRLPDAIVACVGGGSNAAGIFYPFIDDEEVRLVGVEAGGRGGSAGDHAAPLKHGKPGVLHGSLSYVLQDEEGQTADVHSCSAGLDYPGVGPEHSYWKDAGRVEYASVEDQAALDAFLIAARVDGIIPALETAHAVAHTIEMASRMPADTHVVMNMSGRGDKDVEEALRLMGGEVKPAEPKPRRASNKKRTRGQRRREAGQQERQEEGQQGGPNPDSVQPEGDSAPSSPQHGDAAQSGDNATPEGEAKTSTD